MTDVAALPFDQYQRYRLASDLLDEVRPKGTTWSVLDVGGRTALLRSFLPRDRVVPVDLEASSERPLVLGDGSALPFADASFDAVVCVAAFKNFTDPLGALNEMHRVLRPGAEASIFDLRKDASLQDIEAGVRDMHLSAWNAFLTRWAFRLMLLKRAYSREQLERMAALSRFGRAVISEDGIGLEITLKKA